MEEPKKPDEANVSQPNKTAKVTGIGGIFFFSEDPEQTKTWYAKNLGIEVNEWGSSFEFRNAMLDLDLVTNAGHSLVS